MKKLLYGLLATLLILILSACSTSSNEEKIHKNEESALSYGLDSENIKKSDILETINLDNEKIIIFRFVEENGKGINVASILKKNNSYVWRNNMNRVIVKSDKKTIQPLNFSTVIETSSGEKLNFYAGDASDTTLMQKISREDGFTPKVDKDTNIYYYLDNMD